MEFVKWSGVNYYYLSAGAGGEVFMDSNKNSVIKILFNDHKIQYEKQMLDYFCSLAPEYSPGPITLIKTEDSRYGILMKNAGTSIWTIAPQLDVHEKVFLFIQFIDILLCISDKMQIRDFHSENVCAWRRGQMIRLKLIDFESWSIFHNQKSDFDIEYWLNNFTNMKRLWGFLFPLSFQNPPGYDLSIKEYVLNSIEDWRKIDRDSDYNPYKTRRKFLMWLLYFLEHTLLPILIDKINVDHLLNQIKLRATFMWQQEYIQKEIEIDAENDLLNH